MLARVVVMALIAVAAGACTAEPESPASPTAGPVVSESPSTRVPSPSPTPSSSLEPTPAASPSPTAFQSFPPPPPNETDEQAAIREGWEAYNHTLDKFLRDPTLTDLTETQYVTTGDESIRIIDEIALTREAKVRVEGDMLFRDVEIGEVVANGDGERRAVVTYCFDPSHQRAVHIDTGEPYSNPRTTTLEARDTVEQGKDGIWRVALHENLEAPC